MKLQTNLARVCYNVHTLERNSNVSIAVPMHFFLLSIKENNIYINFKKCSSSYPTNIFALKMLSIYLRSVTYIKMPQSTFIMKENRINPDQTALVKESSLYISYKHVLRRKEKLYTTVNQMHFCLMPH